MQLTPGVNFINVLCTNFSYEHHFGSFFKLHVHRKSCWNDVVKTLMKLTPDVTRKKAVEGKHCLLSSLLTFTIEKKTICFEWSVNVKNSGRVTNFDKCEKWFFWRTSHEYNKWMNIYCWVTKRTSVKKIRCSWLNK